MAELHEWLARYRALWDGRLDALERRLGENQEGAMSEHGTYNDGRRPAGGALRAPPGRIPSTPSGARSPSRRSCGHWFPTSSVELELRVGAPMRFVHGDGEVSFAGELRELDPPRRLRVPVGRRPAAVRSRGPTATARG